MHHNENEEPNDNPGLNEEIHEHKDSELHVELIHD